MATRILVAENYNLLRQGIVRLLSNDHELEVVGEATSGFEAITKTQSLRPDVVLLALDLPGLDGIPAPRLIRRETPTVQVILFSTAETPDPNIVEMVQAGARGFITSGADAFNVVRYVKRVVAGHVALCEDLTGKLIDSLARGTHLRAAANETPEASLTQREKEVLQLVCHGTPNKEIAATLFVSENTVRAHVRSLMQKLNADNRTQLAIYAMRHGFGLNADGRAVRPAQAQPARLASAASLDRTIRRAAPSFVAAAISPNAA